MKNDEFIFLFLLKSLFCKSYIPLILKQPDSIVAISTSKENTKWD